MSRSNFVDYQDFLDRSKASIFISTLPSKAFISIESIPLVIGEIGATEKFRVWFYNL
jgi:hypothetical protein